MDAVNHDVFNPQGLCLILDCQIELDVDQPWTRGAIRVRDPHGLARDGMDRASFFAPRTGQLLYGDGSNPMNTKPSAPNRWHRVVNIALSDRVRVGALEMCAALPFSSLQDGSPTGVGRHPKDRRFRRSAVLIAHLVIDPWTSSDNLPDLLYPLVRDREGRAATERVIAAELGSSVRLGGTSQQSFDRDIRFERSSRRIYTVILGGASAQESPAGPSRSGEDVAVTGTLLASLNSLEQLGGLTQQLSARCVKDSQELSGSWSATILRDGAAFVMHAGQGFPPAAMYVSSIYTDALALVRLKQILLEELVNRTGQLIYGGGDPPLAVLLEVEQDVAMLKAIYWKGALDPAQRSQQLATALESQLGLQAAFASLTEDVSALRGLASDRRSKKEAQRGAIVGAFIAFLTIVGFPLGLGLTVWSAASSDTSEIFGYVAYPFVAGVLGYAALVLGSRWSLKRGPFFG